MTTPEELSPMDQVKQLASEILSDDELSRLATWARLEEPQRRKEAASAKNAAATATQDLVQQLWAAQPSLKPAFSESPDGEVPAWVKPNSDFVAYPAGAHITHEGRVWRNDLGTLIIAEPGVGPGWVDVTPIIADGTRDRPWHWEEGIEVQGGQFVEHEGQLYVTTTDHTTTAEQAPDLLIGTVYERFN